MAIQSSILAWRIPWTKGPGGLQSMGSQRVGYDWSDLARTQWPLCLWHNTCRMSASLVLWASQSPGTLLCAVPVFILTQPWEVRVVLIFTFSGASEKWIELVLITQGFQASRSKAEILIPIWPTLDTRLYPHALQVQVSSIPDTEAPTSGFTGFLHSYPTYISNQNLKSGPRNMYFWQASYVTPM